MHNAYHKRETNWIPIFHYSHESITSQLNEGVRLIEIDVNGYNGLPVFHFPFYDNVSNCNNLETCLQEIKTWMDNNINNNNNEQPFIWVEIECKNQWTHPWNYTFAQVFTFFVFFFVTDNLFFFVFKNFCLYYCFHKLQNNETAIILPFFCTLTSTSILFLF